MTQEAKSILYSSLAGTWYPASKPILESEIDGYLRNVPESELADVCALILPHAGYRYSGQTAAHGIKRIAGKDCSRVIVMGPSHRVPMQNTVSVPRATHYETPLGLAPLDVEFIERLTELESVTHHPSVHER
ncbi:MAG: AmmeMemoRadiSam system protein B [Candidatus Omnitrophica bacterium]|nr:AmmeMemoRadiSam system protein B [Candidatus Omnitrophota bacterium]